MKDIYVVTTLEQDKHEYIKYEGEDKEVALEIYNKCKQSYSNLKATIYKKNIIDETDNSNRSYNSTSIAPNEGRKFDYMLDAIRLLAGLSKKFDYKVLDVYLDNDNKKVIFEIEGDECNLVYEDHSWIFEPKALNNIKKPTINDIYDKLVSKNNELLDELSRHLEKKRISSLDVFKGELLKAKLQGFEEALSIIVRN